ncbi:MAG: hypothetical protein ACRCYS_11500 [Beijerinckiaceae bacterium]
MPNRDYFSKPLQGGGRNQADYGRCNFDQKRKHDPWMKPTLYGCAFIAAYFLLQFLR